MFFKSILSKCVKHNVYYIYIHIRHKYLFMYLQPTYIIEYVRFYVLYSVTSTGYRLIVDPSVWCRLSLRATRGNVRNTR